MALCDFSAYCFLFRYRRRGKNCRRRRSFRFTVTNISVLNDLIHGSGCSTFVKISCLIFQMARLNAPVTAEIADNVPAKATRRSKKPLPNLATTRRKKSNEPEVSAEVERESRDENNHESILTV